MDKRIIPAVAIMALVALAGVAFAMVPSPVKMDHGRLLVVASFYPLAYMAERIGGERVTVTCLIQPGNEVHNWQPLTKQLVAASEADVIVYNGAGLDGWMQGVILPAIDTRGKAIVDTTDGVDLLRGMDSSEVKEQGLYDPHTWVSPYVAGQQAENIFDALAEKDPTGRDYYAARWATLKAELDDLDSSYREQLSTRTKNDIFVTHDAFGYLAARYGFAQHGVLGLSADQQPSTQTIVEIVGEMESAGVYTFFLEPGYSDVYVQTVRDELSSRTGRDVRVLKLYHMDGPSGGLDYLQQMEKNLENLRLGLEA
jgi:zinc transport system substrate-binding protein